MDRGSPVRTLVYLDQEMCSMCKQRPDKSVSTAAHVGTAELPAQPTALLGLETVTFVLLINNSRRRNLVYLEYIENTGEYKVISMSSTNVITVL